MLSSRRPTDETVLRNIYLNIFKQINTFPENSYIMENGNVSANVCANCSIDLTDDTNRLEYIPCYFATKGDVFTVPVQLAFSAIFPNITTSTNLYLCASCGTSFIDLFRSNTAFRKLTHSSSMIEHIRRDQIRDSTNDEDFSNCIYSDEIDTTTYLFPNGMLPEENGENCPSKASIAEAEKKKNNENNCEIPEFSPSTLSVPATVSAEMILEDNVEANDECCSLSTYLKTIPVPTEKFIEKHVRISVLRLQIIETAPYKNASLDCVVCERKFSKEHLRDNHFSSVHTPAQKLLDCQFCKKQFTFQWFYDEHLRTHHAGVEMQFCCTECGMRFKTETKLKYHAKVVHTGKTTRPFVCNHCSSIKFENIDMLRDHLITAHAATAEGKAARANNAYSEELKELKNFFNRKLDECQKQCSSCAVICRYPLELDRHTRFFHSADRKCTVCDETCTTMKMLKSHDGRHSVHFCCLCNKSVVSHKGILNHLEAVHMRKTTKGSLLCELCGKPLSNTNRLDRHYFWHKHMLQAPKHSCNICGQLFRLPSTLDIHVKNVHRKMRKKYDCSECYQHFYCKSMLEEHLVHKHKKSELKFKCQLCGKGFMRQESISFHHRKVHMKTQYGLPAESFNKYRKVSDLSAFGGFTPSSKDFKLTECYCKKDRLFKCPVCPSKFGRKDHFTRHLPKHWCIRMFHERNEEGLLKCCMCETSVKEKVELVEHLRIHLKGSRNGNSPFIEEKVTHYRCNICAATIKRYDHFRKHWKRHKENENVNFVEFFGKSKDKKGFTDTEIQMKIEEPSEVLGM